MNNIRKLNLENSRMKKIYTARREKKKINRESLNLMGYKKALLKAKYWEGGANV